MLPIVLDGVAGNANLTADNAVPGILTAVLRRRIWKRYSVQAEAATMIDNCTETALEGALLDLVPLQLLLSPRLIQFSTGAATWYSATKQLCLSDQEARLLNKPVQALLLFSALILHCSRISTLQSSMKWLPSLSSRIRRQRI